MIDKKAYLLLSGGQDSFASLLWGLKQFSNLEAVTVDYQQRHRLEIEYAHKLAKQFHLPHTVYPIGEFLRQMAASSLFSQDDNPAVHLGNHRQASHLPASFVPNRNGIFLTVCANHAYLREEGDIHLITGACQTDYSGYPDCRDDYMKAKAVELSLGLDRQVSVHTPLMWLNKAATFKIAEDSGALKEMIESTLTCYNAVEELHAWGRGCDKCPACQLRKAGYETFLLDKSE